MDIVSYILSKKYVEDSLAGAGAVKGKSAYEIACDNGFVGTDVEWLASLKGDTPQIGPSGTWVIGDVDTGIVASPSLAGYATEEFVSQQIASIPEIDLSLYATRAELNEAILGITIPDVSSFVTQKEIDDAIAAIVFPEPDLSSYALKTDIPSLEGLATEEFVTRKIAEAELGGGDIDLSAFYTKSEIDTKIAEVENSIPTIEGLATEEFVEKTIDSLNIPSVDGLATEEFVEEAIASISIPDITGLASETYVDEAIANIEHPTVDLEPYAKKTDIPSVEGLASEEYVDNAIANIDIPDVKPDINVYEISSDSVAIDELIALLPDGVEIHSGDVMLVSNTLGIKSAYQYDEQWIACDGNVDASKVIMPFDITLAGSYTQVGNLTKTSTGTGTFATKGKSVAQALQEILSKREQPKIKSNPSVSLTATSGAKEVGTVITPTWTATLNAGSYTYGPATGITASSWEISDTDGNKSSAANGSFAAFTVEDDTQYRITAKANYAAGAIALDNLGDPSNPTIQIAAGNKSANGGYITGYRAWFMYVGESLDAIDSTFIRGTTNMGATPVSQENVSIPQGTKRVMIAIPTTSTLVLDQVIDIDGMGLDIFGNFTLQSVDVEGLNGYEAKTYNVWVAENGNGIAATHYNLIIK